MVVPAADADPAALHRDRPAVHGGRLQPAGGAHHACDPWRDLRLLTLSGRAAPLWRRAGANLDGPGVHAAAVSLRHTERLDLRLGDYFLAPRDFPARSLSTPWWIALVL